MLTKWRCSAFHATGLDERLAATGRNQVIVTGVYANTGCLVTAVDAFSRGLETFFIRDALADFSKDERCQAVNHAAARCALVTDTASVCADHADEKLRLLAGCADELDRASGRPVLRIGRLGGQFAKPRSKPTEMHGEVELPAFRGHLINSEEPTEDARRYDPRRMLLGYDASAEVHQEVRRHRDNTDRPGPWSSHEALVIDYEDSLVRTDTGGRRYLASTHFPWVGERTRQPHGGHVALLGSVMNPVGCKLGPKADVDDVLRICQELGPDRRPGRLTLITRMGSNQVRHALPVVLEALAAAGHPVIWMCDPMHANTVTRSGVKTRLLDDVIDEVVGFRAVLQEAGAHPGGLQLEAASSAVTECVGHGVDESRLNDCYESLCDPRLNVEQTREVLAMWTAALPASGDGDACRIRRGPRTARDHPNR